LLCLHKASFVTPEKECSMSRKQINILLGTVVALETLFIMALMGGIMWYFIGPLIQGKTATEPLPAATANVMPDKMMNDPLPTTERKLAQGQFAGADSGHQGSGQATLYQLPDGAMILRLDKFQSTNGPELHVILTSHPAPTNATELMENFLDLGPLQATMGNQNYPLPADTDASQFKNVVIYCQPLKVIFSTAKLSR